jgi:tetratricopeptide (TPR) repeat protein
MSSADTTAMQEGEQIRLSLSQAAEFKAEGNEHYSNKDWEQAIATYRMALGHLPNRPAPPQSRPVDPPISDEEDASTAPSTSNNVENAVPTALDKIPGGQSQQHQHPLLAECAKSRAVLNANIAACFIHLENYSEAAEACTAALKDDPSYVKALQRRASSNGKIGSWSALTQAQEDYNTLLKLLSPSSPDRVAIQRALQGIKPRLEEAQKKETAEMLDKNFLR